MSFEELQRMKHWQIIAATLLIFISGLIAGLALSTRFQPKPADGSKPDVASPSNRETPRVEVPERAGVALAARPAGVQRRLETLRALTKELQIGRAHV